MSTNPSSANLAQGGDVPTFLGAASTGYPTGLPPELKGAVLGTYVDPSPSSGIATKGTRLLTAAEYGFKRAQLTPSYAAPRDQAPVLWAAYFSEVTDGSGRSNYVLHHTLVRDPS